MRERTQFGTKGDHKLRGREQNYEGINVAEYSRIWGNKRGTRRKQKTKGTVLKSTVQAVHVSH